jgi:translation elongation factor EF-1alpha
MFRHGADVQKRRELVHISEWRVEWRERDQKPRVKPVSHTLHHDARHPREMVAKTARQTVRVDEKLRFEIRDCLTITGRGTVVAGDTVSGVARVNDVVDLVHNGWTIRTKIIGTEMGHGPDGMPFHFVGLMLAGVRRFDVVPGDHVSGVRRDS